MGIEGEWEEACRVLGVDDSASAEEVRAQYLYKAQLLHPDKNLDRPEGIRRRAEEELKVVNQAYGVLQGLLAKSSPTPKLSVTPKHIRFKDVAIGEAKETTIEIRNIGGPHSGIWMDEEPAPWLSVPEADSIDGEELPLEVTIVATGTGRPGSTHRCELSVVLENEDSSVQDCFTVIVEMWTATGTASGALGETDGAYPREGAALRQSAYSAGAFVRRLTLMLVLSLVPLFIIGSWC